MKNRVLVFAALLILFQPDLFSQKYFFRRYSVEEGLPQSSVFCLIQDSRGYIWMGTKGSGITRFDGRKFETFSKADGLSDNVVRSIFEDSKGNIWIGTDNGLTLYNGNKFISIGKKDGLNGTSVMKIIEGSSGIIWVASWESGLAGLTFSDSLSIINYSRDDGLVSNNIFDIYEDSEKKLWLGMVGGVNIVEFEDEFSRKIKSVGRHYIKSDTVVNVLSIESDQKGTIWIGTSGHGLFSVKPSSGMKISTIEPSSVNNEYPGLQVWDIFNSKSNELWIATDNIGVIKLLDGKVIGIFNKESGLLSNQILNIMEDREGNVWFASFGNGALMYDDDKFISYTEDNGIIGSQVLDVFFADNNIFYVATEEGLQKFRKEGNSISRLNYFNTRKGLNDVGANVIEKFNKDQIWIGTNKGINILNNNSITEFPQNIKLDNNKVSSLLADKYNNVWIGTAGGLGKLSGDNLLILNQDNGFINGEVSTIFEDKTGRIWIGTFGGLAMFDTLTLNRSDSIISRDFNAEDGLTTIKVSSLTEDPKGNIWIGTLGGGIFKLNNSATSLPISVTATKGIISSNTINTLQFICDTLLIAGNDKGFDLLVLDKNQAIKRVIYYNITDGFLGGENNPNAIATDNEGFIWFGTKNGIVRYDPRIDFNNNFLPEAYVTGIRLFFENVDWIARGFKISKWSNLPENLILSNKENHLTFDFTAFYFHNPTDLEFSYYLENQSKEWSPFSQNREVVFSGLTPGIYTFKIKARNKFGLTGNISEFNFIINPPFWRTPWFYVPCSIIFMSLIMLIIRLREKKFRNEKIKFEEIVKQRTQEVVEQKNHIEQQRDVVTYQKKEITDSIVYAKKIQQAVLPEERIFKKYFSDYFIILRPKDIVSGDFYWMSEKNSHIVFAAADCTGHGVPGALMSMLGVSFLNKIVNESGVVKPSAILGTLRENIISALNQEDSYISNKDGMDIALCSIDVKKMKLWFSGAYNSLFLIRKEENEHVLIEKKGDSMPIGHFLIMNQFTNHEFDIKKGDTIYLFSDGFVDQFGGPDGRKFMTQRFKKMLIDNHEYDMASQSKIFNNILDEWINFPSVGKKHTGQIDDIIVLGLRL